MNDTLDEVITFEFKLEIDGSDEKKSKREHNPILVSDSSKASSSLTDIYNDRKLSNSESGYLRLILKPDKDGDNLLFLAIILGKTTIALLLIDLIPDFNWLSRHNKKFQTALHLATLTHSCKVVRRLVVAGIEVHKQDWRGNTALHIACIHELLDIANALLTPVSYSETKLNSYEIPYQPIPQNLEIRNADGLTSFLIATINRNKDLMDILIANEADINAFDMKSGKTCLHILAEYGDALLTKHVLSKPRVNVNAKTYSGYTAVQTAYSRGHDQVAYLLRCAGAEDVTSDDEYLSDS